MTDTTKCEGFFCTDRETCKRFLNGKGSNHLGWWIKGKEHREIYRECEMYVKLK